MKNEYMCRFKILLRQSWRYKLLKFMSVFMVIQGYAQSPIIIINQVQNYDVLLDGAADPWGGYVVAGYVDATPSSATLLRVRPNGDTLFHRFPNLPGSRFDGLIRLQDGTFLAYGDRPLDTLPPLLQYRHRVWTVHCDTGLNILSEYMYSVPSKYVALQFTNGIVENNGNVVLASVLCGDFSDTAHQCDYGLMRFLPSGDSILIKYINTGYDDREVYLAASHDEDSLLLFGEIGQAMGALQGVHYLDSEFHYLGNQGMSFNGYIDPFTVIRDDANSFLLYGLSPTPGSLVNLMPGICRLNNEAQLITSAQCQPQSLYCNSLDCRGMDKVNSHNFLIGGNKDLTVPWDLYSLTSYYLALFDDGLQQSNLWIFGGDMHYVMHSVIASPLGGCLLSGSRFPDPILGKPNAYLVLMGPDLILQTHEPADEAKNLRLSPNPGE